MTSIFLSSLRARFLGEAIWVYKGRLLRRFAPRNDGKGFLLIEVLLLILILAVVFTSFVGVLRQVVMVSSKGRELTQAISKYEEILFDLETGQRPDLVSYGGKGQISKQYLYEFIPELQEEIFYGIKSKITWRSKEFLNQELYLSEAPTI